MSEFWWNWWVQFAVATGTLGAVLAALFGDWVKHRLFRPDLRLGLLNERGTHTRMQITAPQGEGGGSRTTDSRYYHFLVRNTRRWPVATNVRVFLLQIEEPGPAGALQVMWTGNVPFVWRHQQIFPMERTVGADADCDFFCVIKDKWLSVLLAIAPVDFPFNQRREAFTGVVFTVQARSAEADTIVKRYRVSWDGRWADGELEMARHLTVEDIS